MIAGNRSEYCTFELGGLLFGVDVARVQEVLLHADMTRVPLAHATVKGLVNLRGQIVTALDLRARLGLPPAAEGSTPQNVVLRAEGGAVSLLVDEIGDVLEVGDESYEPPPETLRSPAREFVRGVHKLDGRLLLVLDVARAAAAEVA
jgi:purine-binding chemotaxis protein CheW